MPAPILLAIWLGLAAGQAAPPPQLVPSTVHEPSLSLTLDDAIARGVEHNLSALLARANVNTAAGRRWVALSDLLPRVSADLSRTRRGEAGA